MLIGRDGDARAMLSKRCNVDKSSKREKKEKKRQRDRKTERQKDRKTKSQKDKKGPK